MKTVTLLAAILSLLLLIAMPAFAAVQPATSGRIDFTVLDSAVAAQMYKHSLPGVALAVVRGGEIIYIKGYGTAGAHPMTPQTQMFIGSQSKSFTALAIAQLIDQGKLDLHAPVQKYLPWFQVADQDASGRITVNHFLHHTSGLSEAGYSVVLPPNATAEEAVRSLAQARLSAPVGARFQYFNLGYDVLTCLIETVTGGRYADYLEAQVFDPLGMSHTTADPADVTDLSWGYTRLYGFAVPMPQPVRDYEIGAGYIISTAEDLARYAIAMLDSGTGLIEPGTARQLFVPGPGDYGMGWFITPDTRQNLSRRRE